MTIKLLPFDLSEYLDSDEAISEYISQVLEDGDQDELLRAIGYIAKAKGMAQISEQTGLGRNSLYKTLAVGGNPAFSTMMKVLSALGMKLTIQPTAAPKRVVSKLPKAQKVPKTTLRKITIRQAKPKAVSKPAKTMVRRHAARG